MNATVETGERFVEALRARAFDSLTTLLAADVRFRALLPHGLFEATGAQPLVDKLRWWFGAADEFQVLATEATTVGRRLHLRWRARLRPAPFGIGDGWHVIEQHAFCDAGDRIGVLDLLCSGFLHEPAGRTGARHRFEAGDLGCATGLPQAFRRHLGAVAVGDVLEVVTADPSAREDLPSLARLLGHNVLSVETTTDGRLAITVEVAK